VTNIAAYSYALAAVGFLLLGLPVLSRWRGRAQDGTLSAACLLTAVWAAVLAWDAAHDRLWTALTGSLEVLRDGAGMAAACPSACGPRCSWPAAPTWFCWGRCWPGTGASNSWMPSARCRW
jgi:hypothetical protein